MMMETWYQWLLPPVGFLSGMFVMIYVMAKELAAESRRAQQQEQHH